MHQNVIHIWINAIMQLKGEKQISIDYSVIKFKDWSYCASKP